MNTRTNRLKSTLTLTLFAALVGCSSADSGDGEREPTAVDAATSTDPSGGTTDATVGGDATVTIDDTGASQDVDGSTPVADAIEDIDDGPLEDGLSGDTTVADDAVPDFTGLYTGFINSAAEGL